MSKTTKQPTKMAIPKASKNNNRHKNYKPLKITLVAVAIIAAFVIVWISVYFATRGIAAITAPATADQLYEKVQSYDYSNGHSEEIESDIDRLLQSSITEETRDNYAKTLKSKAEYYYGLQKYYTAVTALKELEDYVVNGDDLIYVSQKLADAYEKFGNEKLATKYQEQYDNLTRKCTPLTEEAINNAEEGTANE